MTCIGFLIFFQCTNPAPITINAYCQTAQIIRLSTAGIMALPAADRRKIERENAKVRRLCK